MVVAVLGQSLMLLALVSCLVVVVRGIAAARIRAERPTIERHSDAALLAMQFAWWATLAGSLLLIQSLVTHRFELAYVADRTSRDLPLSYRIAAYWSGQEGSLLLWLTMLCGFSLLMYKTLQRADVGPRLMGASLGIAGVVAAFFAVLVSCVARPFALVDTVSADGAGMSPALQNYWMAVHPPALYVGYVSVTIPFAIVMGGLVSREKLDDAWIALTRRWSLISWMGLTAGLVLGARWAYEEIGWGGYWAWDPVENAALMPWLAITAFIHSVMVQQKRGMMRFWNVILIALAFCLSIFGTFLTRSGVLSSVHSFVSSSVGWYFIGFLGFSALGSLALLRMRRLDLRARHDVESVVSREATFLFNNLLLVAMTLTVLWGVLYPILTAAVGAERVSLQAPWFNFFTAAFGLPLLAMMVVGLVVPWGSGSLSRIARRLAAPVLAGVAWGVLVVVAGWAHSVAGAAGVSFGIIVLVGVLDEFRREVVRYRAESYTIGDADAASRRVSWRTATWVTLRSRRRRHAAYLAHAGIGMLAIGIAASSAFSVTHERTLKPGQSATIGPWNLTYAGTRRERTGAAMITRGKFSLQRNGHPAGKLEAGRNFYPVSGEVSNEVGIRHDIRTGGDLFVIVDRLTESGTAEVKLILNPMVNAVWTAALLMIAGGLLALLPARPSRARRDQPTPPQDGVLTDAVPADLTASAGEGSQSSHNRVHVP